MEIAALILETISCMRGPTCTYLQNHRKLEANVNHLKRRLNKLNTRKQDVESRIEAEIRSRKVVKKEVETWLQDVQRMDSEIQKIEEKLLAVSYLSRARLGKLVCRKIEEVKEIYRQGIFVEGVAVDGPPATGVALQTTHLEGEIDVKEQIWRYLMGNDVGMIALCGMGGIGKTTIMKHINNQLLKETTFDNVIWVTVSKEFNVFSVQGAIAHALNQFLPEDELLRATTLMEILETKKFVLILDDVWKSFPLLDVGIPEPTSENGSKLVITSRLVDDCKSMGCQVLKVKPLSKEESLNLFVNRVGHGVLQDSALKEIVKQIVEQCCGLPLAIVTIAGTMKGVDDVREWRNALNELCKCMKSVRGSDNEIFDSLMFSYDRLRDPKIQNCFLYCSLYPEDFAIERKELIEKWIEEGFIDECGSRQAMHDRGHSILNKLENNCLLERVDCMEGVKMHDVLRDMALSIKSIGGCQFMVKSGMSFFKKLPGEQEWTGDLDKVSLMRNSISEIPPHISPKCHNLSTLLLQGNLKIKSIPESFFQHMCGLKLLDLSYTGILDLPNSISNLESLVSLELRGCENLRHMPSLAKLEALRKLDLYRTAIKEVPHGIEMLVNLQYLSLYSESLQVLPVGILPKLSHLQYLATSLYVEGDEIAELMKLETFAGRFYEVQDFDRYVKYSMLGHCHWPTNYVLVVGPLWSHEDNYFILTRHFGTPECHKEISFVNCEMVKDDPVALPKDLEFLRIIKCHDLTSLSNISLFHQENKLKECYIWDCDGIECLLDLSLSSCNSLQNIDYLVLHRLCNLSHFVQVGLAAAASTSHCSAPRDIFPLLRVLKIQHCSSMKKLFSLELLQGLQNVEQISVWSCEKLEKIIASEEEEDEEENNRREGSAANTRTIFLPKFRELGLFSLPELKSICNSAVMIRAHSSPNLTIVECPKLKGNSLYFFS